MARKRTRAREVALQFLYSVDGRDATPSDVDAFLSDQTRDAAVAAFARDLCVGSIERRTEIDPILQQAAGRDLRAMAVVDRNVLRMGAFELLFRPDVPAAVSINEAVDLAKRFSTARSGAFVNGVLDRIRKERPARLLAGAAGSPEPEGEIDEAADEGGDVLSQPVSGGPGPGPA